MKKRLLSNYALYVLPNGGGIVPLDTQKNTRHTDPSRMFASTWGAGNHFDAPPVSSFETSIEAEYIYSSKEALVNGWKIDGLISCGIRAVYKIDRGPKC